MKIYILFIIIIVIFFLSLFSPLQTIEAQSDSFGFFQIKLSSTSPSTSDPSLLQNLKYTGGGAGFEVKEAEKSDRLSLMIGTIIYYLLGFLGMVFLILILYAGYLWMTARGESDDVKKAQDTLRNASLGLLLILLAAAITWFVMEKILPLTTG